MSWYLRILGTRILHENTKCWYFLNNIPLMSVFLNQCELLFDVLRLCEIMGKAKENKIRSMCGNYSFFFLSLSVSDVGYHLGHLHFIHSQSEKVVSRLVILRP